MLMKNQLHKTIILSCSKFHDIIKKHRQADFFSSGCDTMTIEKQSEYDQFNGISGNVFKEGNWKSYGKSL